MKKKHRFFLSGNIAYQCIIQMSVVKSLNDKNALRTVVGELQKNIQNCFEIRGTRKVCKSVPGLRTLRGALKHFKSGFPILIKYAGSRAIYLFMDTHLIENIFSLKLYL